MDSNADSNYSRNTDLDKALMGSGEEHGGVEVRKTAIMIYCMRKDSIINKRKNLNKTPF